MTQALDQQLLDLKQKAQSQTTAYAASRNQLHQAIVDTYLWWREADKQKGYLEATYKAAHIDFRKRNSNSPNFYPLVRLVWNLDITKQAGTVSNWARSLLALHEEYSNNPQRYAHKPAADLVNYVKDAGGLGKLRGETQMTVQQLADEENNGIAEGQRGRPKLSAPPPTDVMKSKLEAAKVIKPKATIAHFPTAVTNTDDLVVMLGRRNANGQIEVIGSNYEDALVQNALFACTKLDRSTVTRSLRLVAEALEPHALPAKLEKYRKKFFDDGDVERTVTLAELDKDGNPKTRTENVKIATRLRIRPQHADFVLSKCCTDASVVTYVRPHDAFGCAEEVILRGEDRSWVERELLNEQKLILYTAQPEYALEDAATKDKQRYALVLEDTQAAHKRNLYFYPSNTLPAETNAQPVIADLASLKWDWELEAAVEWLTEFDAQCATAYIDKIRGAFNNEKYRTIRLDIGTKALNWQYWLNEKTGNYGQSFSLQYGNAAKRKDKSKGVSFVGHAKDMAQVFATLPTLPITSSNITLSGNENVLRISYSTELASYETFIPACDADGSRDNSAFAMYGA